MKGVQLQFETSNPLMILQAGSSGMDGGLYQAMHKELRHSLNGIKTKNEKVCKYQFAVL